MERPGAGPETGFLQLDKVADGGAGLDVILQAQAGVGAHSGARVDA